MRLHGPYRPSWFFRINGVVLAQFHMHFDNPCGVPRPLERSVVLHARLDVNHDEVMGRGPIHGL